MKTTFEKVSALNEAFGNPKGDLSNPNIEAIRKQALLCLEEAIEMVEAAYPGTSIEWDQYGKAEEGSVNLNALMDAQGDLTTVNDGVAHITGFNGNTVYDLVHASNMTKFIQDASQAEEALEYYYKLGFEPDDLALEGEAPQIAIKVVKDTHILDKFYPKGKFLKNMLTFKEPDFSDLLSCS